MAQLMFPSNSVIGMVHVRALPGTPFHSDPVHQIVERAVEEARVLAECGFDAILVENMHDRPYVHAEHGPEIVASMTRAVGAIRDAVADIPLGVQVLAGGEREALAVALATGASFVRCENFVFAHVADEGVMDQAAAGPLLRYRRQIGADHIAVLCDIKKKHASHTITSDLGIGDVARGASFFGADGVIVTGGETGAPAEVADVRTAREQVDLPVLVGSGVTPDRASELLTYADALIVGSWIKVDGKWEREIDPERCRAMVEAVRLVRASA